MRQPTSLKPVVEQQRSVTLRVLAELNVTHQLHILFIFVISNDSVTFQDKHTGGNLQHISNYLLVIGLQGAIDDVRTLPLTPQRVTQKTNLSFRNRFPYISVLDEASDLKFGMQLTKWVWPWVRGAPRNLGLSL